MKKLIKRRQSPVAQYFQSESQRKKSNRLAFIYGHKPLVAVLSVLVVVSALTGIIIVQKSNDSKAATPQTTSWDKGHPNTALARWEPAGTPGFTDFAEVNRTDRFIMSLKAGPQYPDGYQVCWKMTPGGVAGAQNLRFTEADFAYTTNEAGTSGVAVYVNDQRVPVTRIEPATAHQGGAEFVRNITVNFTGLPGGGMLLGQNIKFCHQKIGAGKLDAKRTVAVFAYNFRVYYEIPPVPVEVIGQVRDNSGGQRGIAGVKISNCQAYPAATTDKDGLFRFYVNQGSAFCVRTQEGLSTATYSTVRADNANKDPRSADGTSYEMQTAIGPRMTGYEFKAILKPAAAPAPQPQTQVQKCSNTGSGSPVFVEADRAKCSDSVIVAPDGAASGGKTALLNNDKDYVEYVFTAQEPGFYQAVARMRGQIADAKVYYEYKKLNPGAASETKFETNKNIPSASTYTNYTPRESGAGARTNNPLTQYLAAGQQVIIRVQQIGPLKVAVDQLSITKVNDTPAPTPAAPTPTPQPSNNNDSASNNPACAFTSGQGLEVPINATSGIKNGAAANVTDQGRNVVKLKNNGDSVACLVKLPASAQPGGYVVFYSGRGDIGSEPNPEKRNFQSYDGSILSLQMSGGTKGAQAADKRTAGQVDGLSYRNMPDSDRMPVVRSGENKTVRFLQPGELVVVRVALKKTSTVHGEYFLEKIGLFRDPCIDTNGNTITDGRDVGNGVKCGTAPAPTPAPAASTGNTGNAGSSAVDPNAKCNTNSANGERTVDAENAHCVPNTANPPTVVSTSGVRAVELRSNGAYVDYIFKNNKIPGKYRAHAMVKKNSGSGNLAHIQLRLIKNKPGVDITTAEALNIGTSFHPSFMLSDKNYQDLTQEEINQGVTLTVRVSYATKQNGTQTHIPAKIYVDKLVLERVSDPTPAPISYPAYTTTPSRVNTGTSQGQGSSNSSQPSTTPSNSGNGSGRESGGSTPSFRQRIVDGARAGVGFVQRVIDYASRRQETCRQRAADYFVRARNTSGPTNDEINRRTNEIYQQCISGR